MRTSERTSPGLQDARVLRASCSACPASACRACSHAEAVLYLKKMEEKGPSQGALNAEKAVLKPVSADTARVRVRPRNPGEPGLWRLRSGELGSSGAALASAVAQSFLQS